jgi:phospholipid-translocating ATPase
VQSLTCLTVDVYSFFAAIAILQFFPKFSTISPGLVILPLLAILLITALKDGYEDIKRHQSDRRVNHSPIRILQSPEWENPNPMQGKSRTFTPGRGTEVTPWGIYRAWRLRKKHMAQQQGDAEKAGTTPVNGISVQSPGRPRPPHDRATSDPISFVSTAPSAAPPAGKIDVHGSRWAPSFWEDVRVGDFLYIQNGDSIPADVLVISTSEPESVAFVETKNLDGETNLKSRHAITELGVALNGNPDEVMKSGPWRVDVEAPEVNMYKLNGAAVVPHDDGERRFPIDMQTVLLRGTVLRNTKWVVALVLFTGTDTKIVMNSGDTPSKRSRVERQMNPQVYVLLYPNFLTIYQIFSPGSSILLSWLPWLSFAESLIQFWKHVPSTEMHTGQLMMTSAVITRISMV